jgi:putative redox protein
VPAKVHDVEQAGRHLLVRTTCGREVRVGLLTLGSTEQPARRVSIDVGHQPGRQDGTWAALTPAEARQLAAALLTQAAASEVPDTTAAAGLVHVSYIDGQLHEALTRGHSVLTDQPSSAGGEDAGMTPTELLMASLGSCVAFYAGQYLARHGLNRDGLQVTAEFTMATGRPARVGEVSLTIRVPRGVPPEREAALLAVASHCTVHNTLRQPPDITIELAPTAGEHRAAEPGNRATRPPEGSDDIVPV